MFPGILVAADLSTVQSTDPIDPAMILAIAPTLQDAALTFHIVRMLANRTVDLQYAATSPAQHHLVRHAELIELSDCPALPITITVDSLRRLAIHHIFVGRAMQHSDYPWGYRAEASMVGAAAILCDKMEQPPLTVYS